MWVLCSFYSDYKLPLRSVRWASSEFVSVARPSPGRAASDGGANTRAESTAHILSPFPGHASILTLLQSLYLFS